ncbi:aminoacyl-histidine dipeptidase [Paludibacter propionicigenes WB4]|uniref:Cytosol non-specific dipeptidase n=1 Tax=Paludibacter propionicigenes (strain DSM 17365 / JCM 13257 / WB4) TaxID=694427 RepID=E4T5J8_PALPW|nr:aminoacyl-histidine dipeptidase [Paludibacter propionicigenes]ADQ79992.1 aminoacyl-histidine dipeptidase [Paludibacter propionicigenes WB4]
MNANDIRQLEPAALWQNFYNLTRVPRPSHKKEEIGLFLENFGKSLGLETLRDEIGNVLVRKPATPGMENRKAVVLQAHMDMVPQKNSNVTHDFQTDPIDAHIDGEWVTASDTTLGADNGIGLAAAMSVLQSKDIPHPAIEMFVTVDEETGMFGAFGLQPNFLKGDILINMDSEDEGELYVGCAGGIDGDITFRYTEVEIEEGDVALKISLTGLKGGHSGVDIHLQRANANKLMFRFLKDAVSDYEARLASIDGGSLRNAIPREAFAVITVPEEGVEDIIEFVKEYEELFIEEFKGVEDKISFTVEQVELPTGLIPEVVQDDLINSITACPNGVARFIPELPTVVETSNNLAIVKSDGSTITVRCLIRSSVESRKEELASMVESVFSLAGAKVALVGGYPGWKPNLESPILKEMIKVYENKYGITPKIMIIHAGLECGILGTHYPKMDMISFGPTIRYPHSPDEKVNIATVQKFWDFLVATLENIPLK